MLRKIADFTANYPGYFTLATLLPSVILVGAASATQLSNGQTVFDHAPRLVRSASTVQQINTPGIYQFTIMVPEDAGAPLQALKIVQEPNAEQVSFVPNQHQAFLGNSFAGGPAVSLAAIGGEQPQNRNEVLVAFDPPVPPGKTVTVSLGVNRSPQFGGVYLFGVTAYPVGANSPGLFLGHGRIHIDTH